MHPHHALTLLDERGETVSIEPETVVVAGYTGRNRESVQQHIDELARAGIAPPPQVPMFYPMSHVALTTSHRIDVPSAETSGEVEPVILSDGHALFLGIGSDHTARDLERVDITQSKEVCPKVLGMHVVRIEEEALRDGRFDALTLESRIDAEPYQHGEFSAIMPLGELLDLARAGPLDSTRFVLFCGTVPLLEGKFRFGVRFHGRIAGTALPAPLELHYDAEIAGASRPEES